MYKLIRGLLMLAFACIGLTLSSGASAQENQPRESAEEFFGVVHLVPGVPLSRADYNQLREGKPVIFSTFNTDELRAVAEEHGWDSDRVRRFIDSKLSKEGNAFVTINIAGGHLVRSTRFKGVDMDGNCTVMEMFIIADNSSGRPVNTHTTCTGNWQSTFSTAMASALGQTATNVVSIGAQQGFAQLFGPNCGGACGPVFNLHGGTAVAGAEAGSVSQSATVVEIGAGCGSTLCGAQPSTAPPAHYAPANDNQAYQPKTGTGG